jgi:hypothetical protein
LKKRKGITSSFSEDIRVGISTLPSGLLRLHRAHSLSLSV